MSANPELSPAAWPFLGDTSSSAYDIPRGATRELGSASEQQAIIMMMIIICVDHFA
jgi:hypothetical protein